MQDYYKIPGMNQKHDGNFQPDFSGDCPHCGKGVLFEKLLMIPDASSAVFDPPKRPLDRDRKLRSANVFGMRKCPDSKCQGVIFLVATQKQSGGYLEFNLVKTFPTATPEFRREGMSDLFQSLYSECLTCFAAGHYRAAAMMLRRCLEQVCAERGITGGTLHHRLGLLRPLVQMDPRLYDMLFEIKSLGNDSAHVELKSFDEIGQNEVNLALKIFEKVVDAIFHTDDLIAEFQKLKKQK